MNIWWANGGVHAPVHVCMHLACTPLPPSLMQTAALHIERTRSKSHPDFHTEVFLKYFYAHPKALWDSTALEMCAHGGCTNFLGGLDGRSSVNEFRPENSGNSVLLHTLAFQPKMNSWRCLQRVRNPLLTESAGGQLCPENQFLGEDGPLV